MSQMCAGGPLGWGPFNTSDLLWGALFLCQPCLLTLLFQVKNWKLTFLFCILICHFFPYCFSAYPSLACVCLWCVSMHVCVRMHVRVCSLSQIQYSSGLLCDYLVHAVFVSFNTDTALICTGNLEKSVSLIARSRQTRKMDWSRIDWYARK